MFTNIKIISGGQSGVDRAALDFAIKHNIPCCGWCPAGRLAEDGTTDNKYPLQETPSSEYSARTKKNIEDSDGTLIIIQENIDKATQLTIDYANDINKPFTIINLCDTEDENAKIIEKWILTNKINVLNIAGPRESISPGIYNKTYKLLNG